MGLFGKSKKEREKEYMNRLDVPLCLKEDFELIIDDVFTIMGGGTVVTGNISTGMCREGENACVYKTNGGCLLYTSYVLSAGSTEGWKSFVPRLQRAAASCWG